MHDFSIRLALDDGKVLDFVGPADITRETTDAIVNAANSSLLGGGGVDGAIHRAGGPAILDECKQIVSKIGRLAAGNAVITDGGKLPAKYVIHTVGPIYRGGNRRENETLESCHRESIRIADERQLTSLSFPAISTGAFGYPVTEAAAIAVSSTAEAIAFAKHVSVIRFVLFDVATLREYSQAGEKFAQTNPQLSCKVEKGSS
ncbi:MAG: O-acetyl-ADP-ribose deacetylase [Candidatus Sulfotelmatobacter sp.]